ncbi:MAG: hypothetical protein PVG24_14220 [Gammaproteobacteria bacterium]
MAKVMFSIVVLALAGCASMGEWRELQIDGTSESAFNESLSRLNAGLPYWRSEMFALALVDIARTEVQNAHQARDSGAGAYTDENFREQLDGLTYEGVIALADRTGPSISSLYSAGARQRNASRGGSGPYAQTDPYRFPSHTVIPMPSGPGASWAQ